MESEYRGPSRSLPAWSGSWLAPRMAWVLRLTDLRQESAYQLNYLTSKDPVLTADGAGPILNGVNPTAANAHRPSKD